MRRCLRDKRPSCEHGRRLVRVAAFSHRRRSPAAPDGQRSRRAGAAPRSRVPKDEISNSTGASPRVGRAEPLRGQCPRPCLVLLIRSLLDTTVGRSGTTSYKLPIDDIRLPEIPVAARLCYRLSTLRSSAGRPGALLHRAPRRRARLPLGEVQAALRRTAAGDSRGAARRADRRSCGPSPCCSGFRTISSARSSGRCCGAGYRLGETLHYFAYDWRLPVVELGAQLAAEVRRLAAATGDAIDILGLSNGGPIVRAAYAADAAPSRRAGRHLGRRARRNDGDASPASTPGSRFAPLGRRVTPEEFMSCPGGLDSIPEPAGAPVPARGRRLRSLRRRDLAPAATVGLPPTPGRSGLDRGGATAAGRRARALPGARRGRRLRDASSASAAPACRRRFEIVVENGRARLPGEGRLAGLPPAALGDGDGTITVEAAHAWAGAEPEVVKIPVTRHRDMVRTRLVFDAILSALR